MRSVSQKMLDASQEGYKDRGTRRSRLLIQNYELQKGLADASRRLSENHERWLRRVGSELHDGPTQLISLALLRLDAVDPATAQNNPEQASESLNIVRSVLTDALQELRHIARGLALPEISGMTLARTLELAIRNHERRTGLNVEATLSSELPETVPLAIKTAAYRFVQEGLNNAFHHAKGVGQNVKASSDERTLALMVADNGPGISKSHDWSSEKGLGLLGLRDRMISLGGKLMIRSGPKMGTRLIAAIPFQAIGG